MSRSHGMIELKVNSQFRVKKDQEGSKSLYNKDIKEKARKVRYKSRSLKSRNLIN